MHKLYDVLPKINEGRKWRAVNSVPTEWKTKDDLSDITLDAVMSTDVILQPMSVHLNHEKLKAALTKAMAAIKEKKIHADPARVQSVVEEMLTNTLGLTRQECILVDAVSQIIAGRKWQVKDRLETGWMDAKTLFHATIEQLPVLLVVLDPAEINVDMDRLNAAFDKVMADSDAAQKWTHAADTINPVREAVMAELFPEEAR